jgi:hypothetical protein
MPYVELSSLHSKHVTIPVQAQPVPKQAVPSLAWADWHHCCCDHFGMGINQWYLKTWSIPERSFFHLGYYHTQKKGPCVFGCPFQNGAAPDGHGQFARFGTNIGVISLRILQIVSSQTNLFTMTINKLKHLISSKTRTNNGTEILQRFFTLSPNV